MFFSDTSTNLGGVQQTRSLMRVDSTQWPTSKIVNSFNNYHDYVTGFLIATDKRFQWDDTNHSRLPEGTTPLTASQTDYSFLTDQQGNAIISLTGVSLYVSSGVYQPLELVDRSDPDYDELTFGTVTGTPTQYDKIADNIIRLNFKPSANNSIGLKFAFQRVGSRFAATDTTKEPGVSPLLHRGYVIAAAYDGALTLGLPNLAALAAERQYEDTKMREYFSGRNKDIRTRMTQVRQNNR